VEPADGWLIVGCILSGTMILGPIGPIVLSIAFWKLYKSVKAGTNARPWAVTLIGTFCMVDGLISFSPWTFDTFAHSTVLGETFITGYGRFFDGAFYLHYNSRALGGSREHLREDVAVPRGVHPDADAGRQRMGVHADADLGFALHEGLRLALPVPLGRLHDGHEP
jgi:hypothetical protein